MSETFAQQFAELPLEMRILYFETQLATKAHDRLKSLMAMDKKFRGRPITAVDVIIDWTTKAMEKADKIPSSMEKVIMPFIRGSLIMANIDTLAEMSDRIGECHQDLHEPIIDVILKSFVLQSEPETLILAIKRRQMQPDAKPAAPATTGNSPAGRPTL